MNYCTYCGASLDGAINFCKNCGEKLDKDKKLALSKKLAQGKELAFIISAGVAVLALALVLIFTVFLNKPQTERSLTVAELLDLGEKYLLDLDYEQALVQYFAVIEIEPRNIRAYTGAAEAYIGLGNIDGAIAVLQESFQQLADNPGNLGQLAEAYEKLVGAAPLTVEAYINLAEIYNALDDEYNAIDALLRGIAATQSDSRLTDMASEMMKNMTLFDIVTIYEATFYAPDGTLIVDVFYQRPVFRSWYRYAEKFNNIIGVLTNPLTQSETQEYFQEEIDKATEFLEQWDRNSWPVSYGYDENTTCALSYFDGAFISFSGEKRSREIVDDWSLWSVLNGYTFNLLTGEPLAFSDVLFADDNDFVDKVSRLFAGNDWNASFADAESSSFWLSEKGVHIAGRGYDGDGGLATRRGDKDFVIPYTFTDLVRPPFAVESETAPEYPAPVFDKTSASNTLVSVIGENYEPYLAQDGRPDTAWNVPAGQDEWIMLSSEKAQYVTGIRILNGFTKYSYVDEHWLYYKNHRAKDITISFSDGTTLFWTLDDLFDYDNHYYYQDIPLPSPVITTYVKITINSIYQSELWNDICISEIIVY